MDDDLNKPNPRRVQPPQRIPGSQAPQRGGDVKDFEDCGLSDNMV